MAPSGEVRPARESDIPALLGLIESLFAIETDFTFEAAKTERALRMILDSPAAQIFVYEAGGKVIGCATLHALISTAEGGPAGQVEDVVVAADARGKGVGQALLTALGNEARARGMTRLQLFADLKNDPALKFYAANGWTELDLIGRRKRL